MTTASRVRMLIAAAVAATICAVAAVVVVSLLRPGEPAGTQRAAVQSSPADAEQGPPSATPQAAAPVQKPKARTLPQPPPAQPPKSRPKIEDLGQLTVTATTKYGPEGDPNVVVERLDFGGIRVMVKSEPTSSMQASYGLWPAQQAARQTNLDASQLAHVEQFEKEFRPTVESRLEERFLSVERTAGHVAEALAQEQGGDYRRQLVQLERQMKDVADEWQRLYDEYLRGISPYLTAEQRDAVESSLGRKKTAP